MTAGAVMFTWRRFVSILAVFGVLLHASAIVGHNAIALDAALDSAARQRGSAKSVTARPASMTNHRAHSRILRCPICAGLPGSLLVPTAPDFHVPSVFVVQNHPLTRRTSASARYSCFGRRDAALRSTPDFPFML